MNAPTREALRRTLLPAATLAALVLLWEAVVRGAAIPPYILPAPSRIAVTLWTNFDSLAPSWWFTIKIALGALLLAASGGALLAALFALSRTAERALLPLAITLQVTPIVAIAPLILIYVDSTTAALLICAWIVAFFPILSNTLAGLRAADPQLRDLFTLYRASRCGGGRVRGRCCRTRDRSGLAHPGSELPHRHPAHVRCARAGGADRRGDPSAVQPAGARRAGALARQRR
jgi:ABC-type nitrate/sulfonate/bicarbonate transport system permease component